MTLHVGIINTQAEYLKFGSFGDLSLNDWNLVQWIHW